MKSRRLTAFGWLTGSCGENSVKKETTGRLFIVVYDPFQTLMTVK
jgi:hypothetical protein